MHKSPHSARLGLLIGQPRLLEFLAEKLLGVDPHGRLGPFRQLEEGGEEILRELFGRLAG